MIATDGEATDSLLVDALDALPPTASPVRPEQSVSGGFTRDAMLPIFDLVQFMGYIPSGGVKARRTGKLVLGGCLDITFNMSQKLGAVHSGARCRLFDGDADAQR
jgi:hypothetical protein